MQAGAPAVACHSRLDCDGYVTEGLLERLVDGKSQNALIAAPSRKRADVCRKEQGSEDQVVPSKMRRTGGLKIKSLWRRAHQKVQSKKTMRWCVSRVLATERIQGASCSVRTMAGFSLSKIKLSSFGRISLERRRAVQRSTSRWCPREMLQVVRF